MLEAGKEKAALRAAGPLVVGFSCEKETQSRDFAATCRIFRHVHCFSYLDSVALMCSITWIVLYTNFVVG